MENASKALLMAAEVLISLIVISALLLMFNSLTDYQKVGEQNEEQAEVMAFNNSFEAYNRDDVRGNELYSLINKVVDYNRRKSTKGIGDNDEGQYINYEPMTISVDMTTDQEALNNLTFDNTLRIFTRDYQTFTIDQTNNDFKNLFENNITNMENTYSAKVMINLATAINKIYSNIDGVRDGNDTSEKNKIINDFNSAYGEKVLGEIHNNTSNSTLNNYLNTIRKGNPSKKIPSASDVYKYYEYLQFTRAHFECVGVERNDGAGRIIKMDFKFTGEIS